MYRESLQNCLCICKLIADWHAASNTYLESPHPSLFCPQQPAVLPCPINLIYPARVFPISSVTFFSTISTVVFSPLFGTHVPIHIIIHRIPPPHPVLPLCYHSFPSFISIHLSPIKQYHHVPIYFIHLTIQQRYHHVHYHFNLSHPVVPSMSCQPSSVTVISSNNATIPHSKTLHYSILFFYFSAYYLHYFWNIVLLFYDDILEYCQFHKKQTSFFCRYIFQQ